MTVIFLVGLVIGMLAGTALVGVWIQPITSSVRHGLAVEIADEIENRQGYRKAHPEAGR